MRTAGVRPSGACVGWRRSSSHGPRWAGLGARRPLWEGACWDVTAVPLLALLAPEPACKQPRHPPPPPWQEAQWSVPARGRGCRLSPALCPTSASPCTPGTGPSPTTAGPCPLPASPSRCPERAGSAPRERRPRLSPPRLPLGPRLCTRHTCAGWEPPPTPPVDQHPPKGSDTTSSPAEERQEREEELRPGRRPLRASAALVEQEASSRPRRQPQQQTEEETETRRQQQPGTPPGTTTSTTTAFGLTGTVRGAPPQSGTLQPAEPSRRSLRGSGQAVRRVQCRAGQPPTRAPRP